MRWPTEKVSWVGGSSSVRVVPISHTLGHEGVASVEALTATVVTLSTKPPLAFTKGKLSLGTLAPWNTTRVVSLCSFKGH